MPAPFKRQKTSAVAEVIFDTAAREDYLTGFHKRKQARIKHAQEINAKKEREEKIEERRRMRQERKDDLEKHVQEVNDILRKARDEEHERSSGEEGSGAGDGTDHEWHGIDEAAVVNHEEEYIDEDKYTTVTVEAVDITRDGMVDPDEEGDDKVGQEDEVHPTKTESEKSGERSKKIWTRKRPARDKPKQKKKKFRYESRAERKVTRQKERSKNSSQAKARRG